MDFSQLLYNLDLPKECLDAYLKLDKIFPKTTFSDAALAFAKGNDEMKAYTLSMAEKLSISSAAANLYITLRLFELASENYKKRGFDDSVLYNISKDFINKAVKYHNEFGEWGVDVFDIPWFKYTIDGNLFQIGRLQYQLAKSEYTEEIDGVRIEKGSPCFFVHVPGSDPLTAFATESSYKQALAFFKKHLGIENMVCFCYSWLLQPWLSEILADTTNIMKFQRSYRLIETVESLWHTFFFIFPKLQDDLDKYPVDNPLRKMAVERKRAGKFIGYGVGIKLIK